MSLNLLITDYSLLIQFVVISQGLQPLPLLIEN